jgi:hypothetical protein
VLRLDLRRRVATVAVPAVANRRRAFRSDIAMPGEQLASVRNFGYAAQNYDLTVGSVVAVRPTDAGGAEADVAVTNDQAWSYLAAGKAQVHARCSFTGAIGPDPVGGRIQSIEIT